MCGDCNWIEVNEASWLCSECYVKKFPDQDLNKCAIVNMKCEICKSDPVLMYLGDEI